MPTMLEDLYLGKIAPGLGSAPLSPEYRRLQKLLSTREEALLHLLGKDQKEAFLLYSDAMGDLCALAAREDFVRGFRLGAQLLREMFSP